MPALDVQLAFPVVPCQELVLAGSACYGSNLHRSNILHICYLNSVELMDGEKKRVLVIKVEAEVGKKFSKLLREYSLIELF